MPKKQISAEQIVVLLRQIEVQTGQGKTIQAACREAGISDKSYLPVPERVWWTGYGPSAASERKQSLKTVGGGFVA